ncbi:hypothetical protein AAH971_14640, partial [Enterococcus faecalis]|uniref:hypothetical protein n=1 Tax=Enterococcus faecalis TaxID=1351 RepID=UPI0031CD4B78
TMLDKVLPNFCTLAFSEMLFLGIVRSILSLPLSFLYSNCIRLLKREIVVLWHESLCQRFEYVSKIKRFRYQKTSILNKTVILIFL